MRKKSVLATGAAALAVTIALSGCANNVAGESQKVQKAGDASGKTVRVMVGGLNKQIYLPFMLAERLGYYKETGLNIEINDEPAGASAKTSLLAGQIDAVGGFYEHNQILQAKGKDTVAVVSMLRAAGEAEVCRSDLKGVIKGAADFKNRNLGITDQGSATDYMTQYITKHGGVDPSETHRIGVQAGGTFIAALDHKNIDCGMTTEPTISQVVSSGKGFLLYDGRTVAGTKDMFGGNYPTTSLYLMLDYVEKNKDTVQLLVNAYVKTLKWIQDHSAAEITEKLPEDYYKSIGKDAYVKALEESKDMFNPTGLMPEGGPEQVAKVLQANPEVGGKTIDVSKTYTDEFVKNAK
ncbi:ABC transporter substrate-binding protein [Sinomonas sp. G460-2]|uniref:ABC transporter substrate-binding protein n=1 Tax=Sinomonas sp. G460-2 TaxID=3393464 RepID=UPI0039EEF0A2